MLKWRSLLLLPLKMYFPLCSLLIFLSVLKTIFKLAAGYALEFTGYSSHLTFEDYELMPINSF
jgi:hypothetical protein